MHLYVTWHLVFQNRLSMRYVNVWQDTQVPLGCLTQDFEVHFSVKKNLEAFACTREGYFDYFRDY